ncbi:MAG: hypothetical protein H6835_11375 [Planctomycetes bacterium]|nr:hypothetical protein [Planctomycetota bacterium]
MNHHLLIVALCAFSFSAADLIAQQRKAEVRLVNGTVEARIVDPAGVDVYTVFQGVGIGGAVEKPATLGGCISPVFFTIGPLVAHNHQHTIDWTDCTGNTHHRWSVPVPVSSQWLSGSAMAVSSTYGFGCGMTAPVEYAIDAEPVLGTTRTLTASSLPTTSVVAAAYLATAAAPGFGFSLSAVGIDAPECYVFLEPATMVLMGGAAPVGGAAPFSLVVPAAPALQGAIVYSQAVALAPGENSAGVVTSNGVSMVLAF